MVLVCTDKKQANTARHWLKPWRLFIYASSWSWTCTRLYMIEFWSHLTRLTIAKWPWDIQPFYKSVEYLSVGFEEFKKPPLGDVNTFCHVYTKKAVSDAPEYQRLYCTTWCCTNFTGKYRLSQHLNITPLEAQSVMNRFLKQFPGIHKFSKNVVQACQDDGKTLSKLHVLQTATLDIQLYH